MLGPEWELTLESGQELACNPVAMLAQCMCCWPRVPGGQGWPGICSDWSGPMSYPSLNICNAAM